MYDNPHLLLINQLFPPWISETQTRCLSGFSLEIHGARWRELLTELILQANLTAVYMSDAIISCLLLNSWSGKLTNILSRKAHTLRRDFLLKNPTLKRIINGIGYLPSLV